MWTLVNDLDFETGKNVKKAVRTPSIKKIFHADFGPELFKNIKGRRVIKTHLSFDFLPPKLLEKCKVIYVGRNPKDTVVSFFHHLKRKQIFSGTFVDFASFFEAGLLHHSYWHHIRSGWERRDEENLKFLWYENMKADTRGVIDELCDFVQHPLSNEQKTLLCDHVQFDNMKKNKNAYSNRTFREE